MTQLINHPDRWEKVADEYADRRLGKQDPGRKSTAWVQIAEAFEEGATHGYAKGREDEHAEKVVGDTKFLGAGPTDKGFEVKLQPHREILRGIIEALAETVKDANYIDMSVTMDAGEYSVTVQHMKRPTPHDKRKEAEAALVRQEEHWRVACQAGEKMAAELSEACEILKAVSRDVGACQSERAHALLEKWEGKYARN